MNRHILIFGATSAMAEHTARLFAANGDRLALAARNTDHLHDIADDLRLRGAEGVEVLPPFDTQDPESIPRTVHAAFTHLHSVDLILVAHGSLPDQAQCEADSHEALHHLHINFSSIVHLCTELTPHLQAQSKPSVLGVISSVAGLRGRQSNYLYGAAKGGLHIYLQGLRNRLHPHDIRVITFLPGFVDTPMTAHLPKNPLFISAEAAGKHLHRALLRGKSGAVYVPAFWRWIMLAIRSIPESLFQRLKL